MKQLTLKIVLFDLVQVRDPERSDTGGGEIEGDGAPKPSGPYNKNLRVCQFLLSFNAHVLQQNVPRISRQFGG